MFRSLQPQDLLLRWSCLQRGGLELHYYECNELREFRKKNMFTKIKRENLFLLTSDLQCRISEFDKSMIQNHKTHAIQCNKNAISFLV